MNKHQQIRETIAVPLSNGRAVVRTPRLEDSSVSDVAMMDGGEMSDQEWDEYASIITHQPTVEERRQENRRAFEEDKLRPVRPRCSFCGNGNGQLMVNGQPRTCKQWTGKPCKPRGPVNAIR